MKHARPFAKRADEKKRKTMQEEKTGNLAHKTKADQTVTAAGVADGNVSILHKVCR